MADSKVSLLGAAGAFNDADIYYVVQGGVSKKTTWSAIKAAVLLAKYPEVTAYTDLPAAATVPDETYLVLTPDGTWFNPFRHAAGLYRSDGATWSYLGAIPEDYFNDSILQISDDSDPTKVAKFQLSGITTLTTRTYALPDANGTVALFADITATNAGLGNVTNVAQLPLSYLDTDGALTANSDAKVASQKATKTYADTKTTAAAALAAAAGIKLDDFAATDDNTDLNATTTAHGLLLKATAPASGLVSYVGIGNGETAYTNKALFDTTNPAALGTVGSGTSLIAARRDHVHANPAIDTLAAATDITTLDATSSAHGLMPKLDKVRLDAMASLVLRGGFDGGGSVITAKATVIPVEVTGTLTTGILVSSDTDGTALAGSITVTVSRYTPSGGTYSSATSLGTVTLSSAAHSRVTNLSWTVTAGDILVLVPSGITTVKIVTVTLKGA